MWLLNRANIMYDSHRSQTSKLESLPMIDPSVQQPKTNYAAWPDESGHFGPYGGKFVPETLMPALDELEEVYLKSCLLYTSPSPRD